MTWQKFRKGLAVRPSLGRAYPCDSLRADRRLRQHHRRDECDDRLFAAFGAGPRRNAAHDGDSRGGAKGGARRMARRHDHNAFERRAIRGGAGGAAARTAAPRRRPEFRRPDHLCRPGFAGNPGKRRTAPRRPVHAESHLPAHRPDGAGILRASGGRLPWDRNGAVRVFGPGAVVAAAGPMAVCVRRQARRARLSPEPRSSQRGRLLEFDRLSDRQHQRSRSGFPCHLSIRGRHGVASRTRLDPGPSRSGGGRHHSRQERAHARRSGADRAWLGSQFAGDSRCNCHRVPTASIW